jgi:hypothetical protein
MQVKEAKDFLVQQTAEQAQREGVSLSELEKRMLYFTEGEDAVEDPIALNNEFEAEYNTAQYERKIAGLATRAYRRLKKEDIDRANLWDDAVGELNKGDHYISLMLPTWRRETMGWVVWKTVQVSLLFVVAGQLLIGFIKHYDLTIFFKGGFGRKGIPASGTFAQSIVLVQWLLLANMITGFMYAVVAPLRIRESVSELRRKIGRIFAHK